MPYISPAQRPPLDGPINNLIDALQFDAHPDALWQAGRLNYTITRLCLAYMKGVTRGKMAYSALAMVGGVLSDVSNEIYRRIGAKLEDSKIQENGDISGF